MLLFSKKPGLPLPEDLKPAYDTFGESFRDTKEIIELIHL